MHRYIINGGQRLSGAVEIVGNKNAALPCVAAALLTEEPVVLRRMPLIEDVYVMCAIAEELGASVQIAPERNEVTITAKNIRTTEVPHEHSAKIRASFLFAGPLVAREGHATLAPPGGDIIGRRRLDTHLLALQGLGAECKIGKSYVFSKKKRPPAGKGAQAQTARIFLDQASVTATENAVMAAALGTGTVIIENAACEPHTQDLCRLLNAMGAGISGIGSNVLTIEGVARLHGAEFAISTDYMELGSFIGLAAATRSAIEITNVDNYPLQMIELNFRKLGVTWERSGERIAVDATGPLEIQRDFGGAVPQIDDAPWPGFPADLVSIALVIATQARGMILIHEKMYESRLFFVDKLISMGGQIILCDPHRAVVSGPTKLTGAPLSSPDVRAGMALVIAALCAEGESVIHNVYQINRGYQNIVKRLAQLGADIREEDAP